MAEAHRRGPRGIAHQHGVTGAVVVIEVGDRHARAGRAEEPALCRPPDREALLDRPQRAGGLARRAQRPPGDLADDVAGRQAGVVGGGAGANAGDGRLVVDHAHGEAGVADAVGVDDRRRHLPRQLRRFGSGERTAALAGRGDLLLGVVVLGARAHDQHVRLAELANHLVRDPVEGGIGRRPQRERLVLGAHGVPVDPAQGLVVVLVADRAPRGLEDRPAHGGAPTGGALRRRRRAPGEGRRLDRPGRRGAGLRRGGRRGGRRSGGGASAADGAAGEREDEGQRRGQRAPGRGAGALGGGRSREAGDVAAREHPRHVGRVSIVDASGEPAAGRIEADARAVLARQLRRRRRQRGDRQQIRVDGGGLAPRPSDLDAADSRAPTRRHRRPARDVDPLDLDAGLGQRAFQRRGAGRPGVQDRDPFPRRHRPDPPAEGQPPESARGDHPGPIVVLERQVLIVGPGRVERAPGAHPHQAGLGRHRQHAGRSVRARVLGKETDRGGARHQAGAGGARVVGEEEPALAAAGLRVQRAARRGLLVVDHHPRARRGARDLPRRRQAGRPGTDHAGVGDLIDGRGGGRVGVGQRPRAAHLAHHLEEHRVAGAVARHERVVVHAARKQPVGGGQHVDVRAGERVLALAGQAITRRDHAGPPVGPPVDPHRARRAVAVEAEQAAGAVVFGRPPERAHAGREQRGGHRLARESRDGIPLEVDGHRWAGRRRAEKSPQVLLHAGHCMGNAPPVPPQAHERLSGLPFARALGREGPVSMIADDDLL